MRPRGGGGGGALAAVICLVSVVASLAACTAREASEARRWAACRGELAALAPAVELAAEVQEVAVCEALTEALERMPAAHREALGEVKVGRAATFALPRNQPLVTRIYAAAVLGSYSPEAHAVTIYDGALRLAAARTPDAIGALTFWREGPASAAELEGFLEVTKASLGLETWHDYVAAIGRCSGRTLYEAAPGAPEVFEATIACGHRLIGVPLRLDETILHELGHALTYERERVPAQVASWEGLGRWHELEGNQVLRAFVMALKAAEPVPAHCASWYGCTSALEDAAESYRLFLDRPEWLAAHSPERWLVLNALAEGRVFDRFPGSKEALARGLGRVLDGEPALDAELAMNVLRAHADWAAGLALPDGGPLDGPSDGPLDWPSDGPPGLPGVEALTVRVGDRAVRPSQAAVMAMIERRATTALVAAWSDEPAQAAGPTGPGGTSGWERVGRAAKALDARLDAATADALSEVWALLDQGAPRLGGPAMPDGQNAANEANGANAASTSTDWVRAPAERVRLWLRVAAVAERLGQSGQAAGARVKACEAARSLRLPGLGGRLARFVPGCDAP